LRGSPRPKEGALVDAALEPEFISGLIAKIFSARPCIQGAGTGISATAAFKEHLPVNAVRPVGVEQSNTSMVAATITW